MADISVTWSGPSRLAVEVGGALSWNIELAQTAATALMTGAAAEVEAPARAVALIWQANRATWRARAEDTTCTAVEGQVRVLSRLPCCQAGVASTRKGMQGLPAWPEITGSTGDMLVLPDAAAVSHVHSSRRTRER